MFSFLDGKEKEMPEELLKDCRKSMEAHLERLKLEFSRLPTRNRLQRLRRR